MYSNAKTHRTHRTALVLALITLLVAAVPILAAADTAYLEFSSDGLEPLGPGFVYEGWLIVDGAPVSAGRFSVTADSSLSRSAFAVDVDDIAAVSSYVLTIEPMVDADPGPSHTHVLAGDFSGGTAMLSAGHGAALGDDFSSATGPYILNAPSGGGAADYFNGIWWLDPSTGPGPTLELPTLPAGWAYEGWVASAGGPVSTGRFLTASGDDSDVGGISAGPHATPPFPGQDFINPTFDLLDGFAAVISIEPDPDDSPGPFAFKPLVDGMIDDLGAGVPQDMDNNASSFPTAVVSMSSSQVGSQTAHLQLDAPRPRGSRCRLGLRGLVHRRRRTGFHRDLHRRHGRGPVRDLFPDSGFEPRRHLHLRAHHRARAGQRPHAKPCAHPRWRRHRRSRRTDHRPHGRARHRLRNGRGAVHPHRPLGRQRRRLLQRHLVARSERRPRTARW